MAADHPEWIIRTLRDRGMRIPRYVWQAGEATPRQGRLSIGWTVSDRHRRHMHVAQFTCDYGRDLLPPLRDVHVVRLDQTDLTIAGFEMVEDREYAQTWYCRLSSTWEIRGKPDDPTGDCLD